jgi:hypothetical protein
MGRQMKGGETKGSEARVVFLLKVDTGSMRE